MYYGVLQHITAYTIVLLSIILFPCALQCIVVVYCMFQYIKMYCSVLNSITIY